MFLLCFILYQRETTAGNLCETWGWYVIGPTSQLAHLEMFSLNS